MKESPALRAAAIRFYEGFSANDAARFDDFVAADACLFIGTDDDEWFADRAVLRSGFAWDGIGLDPGDPQGWEEGTVGWVADRPVMRVASIGSIRTRFTGVFRREGTQWKLVMSHFSVGVPDAEVGELQRGWLGG